MAKNKTDYYINQLNLMALKEEETDELIQLVPPLMEEDASSAVIPDELPILPVKNTVLFPGVVIPITVSRKKSIKLVQQAYKGERTIGVVAQKNTKVEDPMATDIYEIGTIAKILKMLILPDGNTTIIIQGNHRFHIDNIIKIENSFWFLKDFNWKKKILLKMEKIKFLLFMAE